MTRWKCRKCVYVYDPRVGDPDGGIAPGTPFERIPASWRCPICGATKADFYPLSPAQPARPMGAQRPVAGLADPKAQPRVVRQATSPPAPAAAAVVPPSGWTVGSLKGRQQPAKR